jgi:hypothetical protein
MRNINMTCHSRFKSVLLTGLVTLLCVSSETAQAQVEKPFKINGQGIGPTGLPLPGQPPRPHFIEGNATHLGRHCGRGAVQTLDVVGVDPDTGVISGIFESNPGFKFYGANGDVLACTYGDPDKGADEQGTFTLTPVPGKPGQYVANFIAEFVPTDECTGKFEGVTGSWIMYAVSKPFVLGSNERFYYSWHGEGTLTFKKRK